MESQALNSKQYKVIPRTGFPAELFPSAKSGVNLSRQSIILLNKTALVQVSVEVNAHQTAIRKLKSLASFWNTRFPQISKRHPKIFSSDSGYGGKLSNIG